MSMRACVIFDSRYGNTEKIAESFGTGLREAGIQTICINAKDVNIESLTEYDLIAVGAPTEKITASQPIKEFLQKMGEVNLSGKFGFAFDTKLPYPLTGSAAKFIEKKLKDLGLDIVSEKASALVIPEKGKDYGKNMHEEIFPFKDGEEKRFVEVGHEVGTAILKRGG